MYYIVCFIIYILLILISLLFYKKSKDKVIKQARKSFKNTFESEGIKKNDLPRYQVFLYYIYFWLIVLMLCILPLIMSFSLYFFKDKFFIPNDAIYFYRNPIDSALNYFSCILLIAPFICIFDYIVNRGFIKKVDSFYYRIGFSYDGIYFSIMCSLICFLIGLPILLLSFNSYKYCTDNQIIIKSAFEIDDRKYTYDDIDLVKRKVYNTSYDYRLYFKDGYHTIISDEEKFEKIIKAKCLRMIDINPRL